MEKEQEPLMFSFAIYSAPGENGMRKWTMQLVNSGVPEELVLTYMRHWLRNSDNKYHNSFKEEHSL